MKTNMDDDFKNFINDIIQNAHIVVIPRDFMLDMALSEDMLIILHNLGFHYLVSDSGDYIAVSTSTIYLERYKIEGDDLEGLVVAYLEKHVSYTHKLKNNENVNDFDIIKVNKALH